MLGDTAVAVHPGPRAGTGPIGKQVRLPLVDRLIPIIADDILVDPKFGTGCVKVTPAHDPNDYAVWQRHQGKADQIDIINILNPDGTINENAGAYTGMKRDTARKKVVEDLKHQGLLVKEEPYETQVGHSDRSKTPIEPYLSDQWFVHMAPLAEPAPGGGAQGQDQVLSPNAMRISISPGSAKNATGPSPGSCGGGIGFRCGREKSNCPPT